MWNSATAKNPIARQPGLMLIHSILMESDLPCTTPLAKSSKQENSSHTEEDNADITAKRKADTGNSASSQRVCDTGSREYQLRNCATAPVCNSWADCQCLEPVYPLQDYLPQKPERETYPKSSFWRFFNTQQEGICTQIKKTIFAIQRFCLPSPKRHFFFTEKNSSLINYHIESGLSKHCSEDAYRHGIEEVDKIDYLSLCGIDIRRGAHLSAADDCSQRSHHMQKNPMTSVNGRSPSLKLVLKHVFKQMLAWSFLKEEETLYEAECSRFFYSRSVPAAVALILIIPMYYIQYLVDIPRYIAENRIVHTAQWTGSATDLACWLFSVAAVLVLALRLNIDFSLQRYMEPLICIVNFAVIFVLYLGWKVRVAKNSSFVLQYANIVPDVIVMLLINLLLINFVFCVRMRYTQWVHLTALTVNLIVCLTLTLFPSLRAHDLFTIWTQGFVGCYIIGSTHWTALTRENDRRTHFLLYAFKRHIERERRQNIPNEDEKNLRPAAAGLVHSLQQMELCLQRLYAKIPEGETELRALKALWVDTIDHLESRGHIDGNGVDQPPQFQLNMRHDSTSGWSSKKRKTPRVTSVEPTKPEKDHGSTYSTDNPFATQFRSPVPAPKTTGSLEVLSMGQTGNHCALQFKLIPHMTVINAQQFLETSVLSDKNVDLSLVGRSWTLNIQELDDRCNGNAFVHVGLKLLEPFRTSNYFICSKEVLVDLLLSLQSLYPDNKYHNQVHATMVTHLAISAAHMLDVFAIERISVASPEAFTSTKPLDIIQREEAALIIAALGHDAGHFGKNNHYLSQASTTLSLIYNDKSVLENYHCCLTFYTLSQEACNIFQGMEYAEFQLIRKIIIELILSTDMAHHFDWLSRAASRRRTSTYATIATEEDRRVVLALCLKLADIGHCATDWDTHALWADRVKEEFYDQGDIEYLEGLPVSPLCDRRQNNQFPKSQANFITFLFLPLADHLAAVAPNEVFNTFIVENAKANARHWWQLHHNSLQQNKTVCDDNVQDEDNVLCTDTTETCFS